MSDKEMNAEKFKKKLTDDNVEFVDLRLTDPRGKLHHITYDAKNLSAENIAEGFMFDASSIDGWKSIDDSDMFLSLDLASVHNDPFYAQNTVAVFCDILEPSTAQGYNRDPRYIAHLAENWLRRSGIADTAYFGHEAEFFVFDDVRFVSDPYNSGFKLDSIELPINSNREYEMGNLGHRPRTKKGYFPVNPVDSAHDMRSEMVSMINEMGVVCDKHHHEVASSQYELGTAFDALKKSADNLQIYKYAVHNVANSYGKTATFMPKPVYGDNGTGLHCHQSLWKDGKTLFAGNRYADLSDTCLYYIGGIIKHARVLNALTNPATNSYKRLVPGFEAPVLLAYSAKNRSAACRIPFADSPNAKRLEVRFPDPCANPYLAFAAMLMAGLDGIENKIHPGEAMDKNLYDLPPQELKDIPQVCGSLREAVENLDNGRDFLKKGNVFTDDFIDAYIELKKEEVARLEHAPHPVEFDMYYSL